MKRNRWFWAILNIILILCLLMVLWYRIDFYMPTEELQARQHQQQALIE